jgi:hypothetical protein
MENRGVIEGCQGKQAVPVKGAMLLLVALLVKYSLRSGGTAVGDLPADQKKARPYGRAFLLSLIA